MALTLPVGPFAVVDEHLSKVLSNCYDAIGLMLMIRMNQQHQVLPTRRRRGAD